jgi:hypothetical protein
MTGCEKIALYHRAVEATLAVTPERPQGHPLQCDSFTPLHPFRTVFHERVRPEGREWAKGLRVRPRGCRPSIGKDKAAARATVLQGAFGTGTSEPASGGAAEPAPLAALRASSERSETSRLTGCTAIWTSLVHDGRTDVLEEFRRSLPASGQASSATPTNCTTTARRYSAATGSPCRHPAKLVARQRGRLSARGWPAC